MHASAEHEVPLHLADEEMIILWVLLSLKHLCDPLYCPGYSVDPEDALHGVLPVGFSPKQVHYGYNEIKK